jgi:lipooligosaccharide transport system ATP-binding protein
MSKDSKIINRSVVAKKLTKTFGERRAVDGISFVVESGQTFALLGANGAGKSTVMRMIACRSPLTDGELTVENLDVETNARQIRGLIGVVPQENNLDPDLNVRQNLEIYASYFRLGRAAAADRINELLDFIRLSDRAQAKIEELSGGMKRRLMIARALLHRPKMLLLDEPTNGLDPSVRQDIWEKLELLRREENLTILLSTHYMEEAEKLCQQLLVLSKGKIVACGNPRELIEAKISRFALEIRDADNLPLQIANGKIQFVKRGTTHLYFANAPDALTPLIQLYNRKQTVLRLSNLEDVFLQLSEDEEK